MKILYNRRNLLFNSNKHLCFRYHIPHLWYYTNTMRNALKNMLKVVMVFLETIEINKKYIFLSFYTILTHGSCSKLFSLTNRRIKGAYLFFRSKSDTQHET